MPSKSWIGMQIQSIATPLPAILLSHQYPYQILKKKVETHYFKLYKHRLTNLHMQIVKGLLPLYGVKQKLHQLVHRKLIIIFLLFMDKQLFFNHLENVQCWMCNAQHWENFRSCQWGSPLPVFPCMLGFQYKFIEFATFLTV